MRNLLIAKVCGADSDLMAATPDQRPALAKAAALFSEEDLTRFFQILLQTDDDLRRKLDARVHLEMGMLRLINAARMAPLEELLAEIKTGTGGAPPAAPVRRAASAAGSTSIANVSGANAIAGVSQPSLQNSQPSASPVAQRESNPTMDRGAAAAAMQASAAAVRAKTNLATAASSAALAAMTATAAAAPAANGAAKASDIDVSSNSNGSAANSEEASANGLRCEGITQQQVSEIKAAVQKEQKFLGELLEHAAGWELAGPELKLYFPAEKKSFAEMLEGRDSLEKVRSISSNVLGRPIRVCAKLEASTNPAATSRAGSDVQELRAKFERDPMVRSLLQRFGGKISEVRKPQGE